MTEPPLPRMYTDLAWAWPLISPPEDYQQEAGDFTARLLAHARRPLHSLLHLGCGGGHLDHWLQAQFAVTGVDLSPAMLDLARRLNPGVTYLPGELRTLRLPQAFDAVIIADSIAYMLTEAELLQAFQTAYAHLAPGGVFCTYVEAEPETFEQNRVHSFASHGEGVDLAFLRCDYDPDPSDTTFEMTFVTLIRRPGQPQQIITDTHLSGIFPLPTWQRLLRQAGFEAITLDETSYGDPSFTCIK